MNDPLDKPAMTIEVGSISRGGRETSLYTSSRPGFNSVGKRCPRHPSPPPISTHPLQASIPV